jgi:murein hydrolase activator
VQKPNQTLLILFSIILNISLAFWLGTEVCPADDSILSGNKENQIQKIETDLTHEKEQYIQFDQKEKGLLEQLSDIEKQVNEKKIILKELEGSLKSAQGELKKQREVLSRTEVSYNQLKNLLNKRLVAFYKYAKRGYLRIFTNVNDLTQLNHMIKYLRVILDKDLNIMKQASREHQNYKQQVSIIEKQFNAVTGIEKEESSKMLALKTDLENKVLLLSRIHKEKEFYETAVKELGSATENLKNTIKNLDYIETKVSSLPSGFGDLKGRLPLPLMGKIEKENKKSADNIFNSLKGIYITGPFGADVRSVFHGRVDYSGQLKGYGQVIVINHGERFFTISAYLSHRNKAEGEKVEKGEVIGQVGETGLLAGPALYFEIRKGDDNLDPLKWLKVN